MILGTEIRLFSTNKTQTQDKENSSVRKVLHYKPDNMCSISKLHIKKFSCGGTWL